MSKRVIWHPAAKEDLREILTYCRDEFGSSTAKKVRERILSAIACLSQNPLLGFVEEELNGVTTLEYRSLIVKQTKVIHSVHENHIYIHLLWNTWRNPDRMSPLADSRS